MKQTLQEMTSRMQQAMSARHFDEAARLGEKLVRTHPKRADLQLMTSVAELQGTHLDRGGRRLLSLLDRMDGTDRHLGMVLQNLSAFARARGDYGSVIRAVEKKHARHPSNPFFTEFLASLIAEDERRFAVGRCYSAKLLRAISLLESIPDTAPRAKDARMLLLQLYLYTEMNEKAFALFDKLIAADPENVALRQYRISAWALSGKIDPAVSESLDLISKNATIDTQPYLVVGFLRPQAMPAGAKDHLFKVFDDPKSRHGDRFNAGFALARIAESEGDFEKAFAHYQAVHKVNRANSPFDITRELAEIDQLSQLARDGAEGKTQFARPDPARDAAGPKPIFIVGMPRSGTTLTERIIGAHDDVVAVGETGDLARALSLVVGPGLISEQIGRLTDKAIGEIRKLYLEAMRGYAPDARFVANKTPANFLRVGLIRLIFPDAPVIHCQRNPLAVTLSIYTTPFANAIRYADDLDDLAAYYRGYEKLMAIFGETDGEEQIFDLSYEALVNDPEAEAPRLLAHCGLEWQAKCLEFYRSEKAAKTASLMQVRRPINSDAVDKWQRFAPYIGPLAGLQEADDATGEKKSGSHKIEAA